MRSFIFILAMAFTFNAAITASIRAHDVAAEMANNANAFLKSLNADQKNAAQLKFDDPLRKDWQFIPMERKGLGLKQMKPHQRGLAMALVQTALSHRGFSTSMQIMAMEQVLFEIENNSLKRDPAKYHLFLFGKPSVDSSWGWRIEGHHLSISVTLVEGKTAVIAPSFLGANPASVRTGSMKGIRALGDIEDLGRSLVKQLSVEQKKLAVIPGKAPRDVINGPGRTAEPLNPAGISAKELNADQKKRLQSLLDSYLSRFRAELASEDRQKIQAAGFDNLHFAWAGEIQPERPHYFRVQGPTFILEYDNTQNGANHAHVVWRDFKNDFGADAVRKHYETSHRADKVMKPGDDDSESNKRKPIKSGAGN
jgi:hypothetical protein